MWYDVKGHDEIAERFLRIIQRRRLASTYLFVGPEGIGKHLFATRLAQALLCQSCKAHSLDICNQCDSCRFVQAGSHPDLMLLGLPPDKSTLPIDLFIGDRDHRHQTGMCYHLSRKPYLADRRIAIIDGADHLSQESANCLLKTLEEPPPHSLLILVGTSPSRQLPTIRSRSQLVRFQSLPQESFQQLLEAQGMVATPTELVRLAALSEGSLARARELTDPEFGQFHRQLIELLKGVPLDVLGITKLAQEFTESAGKEASLRRNRLRAVFRFATGFFRENLLKTYELSVADKIDHCLDALQYVDRNANQASLMNWWADGLAK